MTNRFSSIKKILLKIGVGVILNQILILLLKLNGFDPQSRQHLERILETLRSGSVLFVANHPNSIHVLFSMALLVYYCRMVRNWEASGIFISTKFKNGQMGFFGTISLYLMAQYGVSGLPIHQKKYYQHLSEAEQRLARSANASQLKTAIRFLKTKGGAFGIYPEGTRSWVMKQAEPGLSIMASYATLVCPVTTVPRRFWFPKLIIHEPITGVCLLKEFEKRYGEETGRELYSDHVMTIIASSLPETMQGYYQRFVALRNQTLR